MKLIQLNVWGGALSWNTPKFLGEQNADILLLQEVNSAPGEHRSRYFDFLQEAERHTGLPETFFSKTLSGRFCHRIVDYGNAILSRFALGTRYEEFTCGEYEPDFSGNDEDGNTLRLFQHATFETASGKKVNLINYHGYCQPKGIKTGDAMTTKHCQQLADYIAKLEGPKILAGDFNLEPSSVSLKPLNAMMRNLCIEHDVQTTRNQFAFVMDTVDYIWVSDGITVNKFEVLPDLVSDHAALLLDFDVA